LLAVAEELIARSLAPLAFLPGRAHHPTQRQASPRGSAAQAV
jgi:hypothetical protein